jgi:hypothetical protein
MTYGVGRILAAAAVAAALTMTAMGEARADNSVKAGFLQCSVGEGMSQFITSTRKVDCTYDNVSGGTERYTGEIRVWGIDLTYVDHAILGWAVFAPSYGANAGELAGEYGGAKASVAIGVGVGANVLVGGFNNSITLQPVSLEGIVGSGVSVGIAHLTLTAAR